MASDWAWQSKKDCSQSFRYVSEPVILLPTSVYILIAGRSNDCCRSVSEIESCLLGGLTRKTIHLVDLTIMALSSLWAQLAAIHDADSGSLQQEKAIGHGSQYNLLQTGSCRGPNPEPQKLSIYHHHSSIFHHGNKCGVFDPRSSDGCIEE